MSLLDNSPASLVLKSKYSNLKKAKNMPFWDTTILKTYPKIMCMQQQLLKSPNLQQTHKHTNSKILLNQVQWPSTDASKKQIFHDRLLKI